MEGHEKAANRFKLGKEAEDEFDLLWLCFYCEVPFVEQPAPKPDRICPQCGLEVDIKASPEANDSGEIPISERPFDAWHSGVIIAWRPKTGEWYGTRKYHCEKTRGPFPPKHKELGTSFYLVSIESFEPLEKILKRVTR